MASKFVQEYKLPAFEGLLAETSIDAEEKIEPIFPVSGSTVSKAEPCGKSGWATVAADTLASTSTNPPRRSRSAAGRTEVEEENWHEIPEARLTPELRRDLVLLENRAHLDPKRFYKSSGTGRKRGELPTRVHIGTVVEAPHEYLSGRLTKKERKKSFADEVFSDGRLMENAKRRFQDVQKSRQGNKRVIDPAARAIRKKRRSRRGSAGDNFDDW